MMCQCRLVNCNRCTIQMQNADSMTEGDERCVGTLHILSFAVKIKNKIFYKKKKKKKRHVTIKGATVRLTTDFSMETIRLNRQ